MPLPPAAQAATFHTPPGWCEEPVLGARRAKVQWVQRDACGALLRQFERRAEVEEVCEAEAATRGEAWLGQIAGGFWEIRQKAMVRSPPAAACALAYALTRAVATSRATAIDALSMTPAG